MEEKHTPGPWIVVDGHWLKPAGKTRIVGTILNFDGCMVYRDGYTNEEMDAEVEANKRLIASAPDLLEALKWFEMFVQRDGEGPNEKFERIGEVFYRETGYLRPGKDCRINSPEDRQAAWDEWIASYTSKARAAIAKATGAA